LSSYEHKQLIKEIELLDKVPDAPDAFASWLQAGAHLDFLRRNARAEEIVIYASGWYSFIHTEVIPHKLVETLSPDDLLKWEGTPFISAASYMWGGSKDVRVERSPYTSDPRLKNGIIPLVFGRTFEGWSGSDRFYFEVNQEYTHLTGIHSRPEYLAYCRYDENGDLEKAVSITVRSGAAREISCVSFIWPPLEEYLAATNACLIRRFDFTLYRPGDFTMCGLQGPETFNQESCLYKRCADHRPAAFKTDNFQRYSLRAEGY
jgi:hypothetical protein